MVSVDVYTTETLRPVNLKDGINEAPLLGFFKSVLPPPYMLKTVHSSYLQPHASGSLAEPPRCGRALRVFKGWPAQASRPAARSAYRPASVDIQPNPWGR